MRKRLWRAAVLTIVAGMLVGLSTSMPATALGGDPSQNPCMSNSSFSMSLSRSTLVWGQTATITIGMNVAAGCTILPSLFFVDQNGVTFSEPFAFGSSVVQPPSTGHYDFRVVSNGNFYDVVDWPVTVNFPVLGGHPWARITRGGDQAATFAAAIRQPSAYVYVQGDVNLDLSGMSYLQIGAGTQIIGERDAAHPDGPRLFTTSSPNRLFIIGDDRPASFAIRVNNVRITGIRLDGMEDPDPCAVAGSDDDADAIWILASMGIEIDHDEIYHWPGSGVHVEDTVDDVVNQGNGGVTVLDNYFHDNQHPTYCGPDPTGSGHGLGYGVQVSDGGFATITGNTFSDNRHSIAGHGSFGDGYLAIGNLFLNPGIDDEKDGLTFYNHQIDMHGLATCPNLLPGGENYNCGQAGDYMEVANNTVVSTAAAAIQLRGIPSSYNSEAQTGGMQVHDNRFADTEGGALTQTLQGLVEGPGNVFGDAAGLAAQFTASPIAPACDFDGDGTPDPFRSSAGIWWYHSSLANRWVYLRPAPAGVTSTTLGDVDGDGLCDVTDQNGTHYYTESMFFTISLNGPVPNVVGSTQAGAADAIAAAGMTLDTVTPVLDSSPVGTIVSQSVVAGSSRQAGSLVALTVSAPHSTVPPVTRSTESSAVRSINSAGLTVGTETRVIDTSPAGTVIGQSPAGGQLVVAGSAVALTVSLGPVVPNVLGHDQTTAGNMIRNAGYVFATPLTLNDCIAPNNVEVVNPQVGTSAPPGTVVTVTISTCTRTPGGGGGVQK